LAKVLRNFLRGRVGVFYRIVQQGRDEDLFVLDTTDFGQIVGDFDGVIDVGSCISVLPTLGAVFLCGKKYGIKQAIWQLGLLVRRPNLAGSRPLREIAGIAR
jgi:hypothetical protein